MSEENQEQKTPEQILKEAEEVEKNLAKARKEELVEMEKRIDEKAQALEKLKKDIEQSGRSVVFKQPNKEEIVKARVNQQLERLGLKI